MLSLNELHFLKLYSSSTTMRSGSSEHPHRTSPGAARSSRPPRAAGSDPNSDGPSTKSPTGTSSKVDRRTAVSVEREKKRPITKLTGLESQLSHLQEELKKSKEQLVSSELSKKRALQEAEEAKRQVMAMSSQLKDSESQLAELSSAEESRLLELRRLSQERDRSWQSELEAMQKQHAADSAALVSAMGEVHRLRVQLAAAARADRSDAELELKREMVEALTTIDELRLKLKESEEAEAEAKAMQEECKQQLEASRATIDSLLTDGSKLMDSFSLVVSELEESRARVRVLEEMVERSEKGNANSSASSTLDSAVAELRSALEATEAKFQEEQILSTVETQCAYELIDQIKMESDLRQQKLVAALESSKSEVIFLKASLFDKDAELRRVLDMNKRLQADMEKKRMDKTELDTSQNVSELKEQLRGGIEENGQLKLEVKRHEMEKVAAKKAADENRERLGTAEAVMAEMEAELRKLRVQAEQWRKAAETAMALLTVGKGSGRLMERSESLDPGKFLSSPFAEEFDEDSAGRKNGNVLRRISGMWKK